MVLPKIHRMYALKFTIEKVNIPNSALQSGDNYALSDGTVRTKKGDIKINKIPIIYFKKKRYAKRLIKIN